ncbi:Fructose-1,6-bisphosphatase class 1 [Gossypium arboreum]|uniref:Fructose-1,6-bisphosphatase class 1 n=1 Tax=Gossypium arboreum TaxID=29729 RepID=A0A0B0NT54_GOSAR|nr:Fructose-1,6-bisphosphatase class 1 [Gossypium arboreum]
MSFRRFAPFIGPPCSASRAITNFATHGGRDPKSFAFLGESRRYPKDLGDGRVVRDAIRGWIEGRLVTGALVGIEGPRDSALMAASILGTEQTLPESSRTYYGAIVFRKP